MWIDKTELNQEVASYQITRHVSDVWALCCWNSPRGVALKYAHDLEQDEAVSDGVLFLLTTIHKYDPKQSSAFNFATTCLRNRYNQLRREQGYREMLCKHLVWHLGGEDLRPKIPEYKICNGCGARKSSQEFEKIFCTVWRQNAKFVENERKRQILAKDRL
ncbi:MAG: hypothetical protein R3C12_18695 [Planctomycetaceae bacterium]